VFIALLACVLLTARCTRPGAGEAQPRGQGIDTSQTEPTPADAEEALLTLLTTGRPMDLRVEAEHPSREPHRLATEKDVNPWGQLTVDLAAKTSGN